PFIHAVSLHDALPISRFRVGAERVELSCPKALAPKASVYAVPPRAPRAQYANSGAAGAVGAHVEGGATRERGGRRGEHVVVEVRSEEHTSELQSPDHL